MPYKQPEKGRPWLNDGSCVRLRPQHPNHIWSYDFVEHRPPDNGPAFVARAVRDWIAAVGARAAFIEPGSPWANGYCESFNSRLRDELLARLQAAGSRGHRAATSGPVRPSRKADKAVD